MRPHVYVRAWALGCFHSLISTQTFRRALTASGEQLRGDKEYPFSGVTKSDRVWRKVPVRDARSVHRVPTNNSSQALRPEERGKTDCKVSEHGA